MRVRGDTRLLDVAPVANKNVDPKEAFLPTYMDLRNGYINDQGRWARRPGYAEKWDLGVSEPVEILIPEGAGYAALEGGRMFQLGASVTELSGAVLTGSYRPQHVVYRPTNASTTRIIIVDGGTPTYISGTTATALGGSPPSFKIGRAS